MLVTAPGRFKDVRDLVEQAKSKPGTLNYGSAGNGSATHMNAEVFRFAAGIQAQHVPFKGTPEALNEVMAGRIDWFFAPMVSALSLVQERQAEGARRRHGQALRRAAAGADDGRGRRARAPSTCSGSACSRRRRRRRPIVDRLHDEVAKIMTSADMKERLDKLGAEPFVLSPAAFDKFIVDETAKSQQIVRAAGIKLN